MRGSKFLIELNIVIIGIGLAIAIQGIVTAFSIIELICFISYFFLAIDFFYAKICMLEDSNSISIIDFFIQIFVLATFAFIPYFLSFPIAFIASLLVLRLLDSILITIHCLENKTISKIENKWLFLNIFLILIYSFFIISFIYLNISHIILLSINLFLVVIEVFYDFKINKKYYRFN